MTILISIIIELVGFISVFIVSMLISIYLPIGKLILLPIHSYLQLTPEHLYISNALNFSIIPILVYSICRIYSGIVFYLTSKIKNPSKKAGTKIKLIIYIIYVTYTYNIYTYIIYSLYYIYLIYFVYFIQGDWLCRLIIVAALVSITYIP
jgi:hypothetical protein